MGVAKSVEVTALLIISSAGVAFGFLLYKASNSLLSFVNYKATHLALFRRFNCKNEQTQDRTFS